MFALDQTALALNAGGAPGGGTTGAPPASSMSPLALGGLAAMLGGGLLDYIGQRQGARAMEREALRQAAEQEAFARRYHDRLANNMQRFDPAAGTAYATGALLRANAATTPALAAGGDALGLSRDAVVGTQRGMLPAQRFAAQRVAEQDAAREQADRLRQLGIDVNAIEAERQMHAALYPLRSQVAAQRGGAYRLAGSLLSGAGMPAITLAMARPAPS